MSTCLIGVHLIHYRPVDQVSRLMDILPLSQTPHIWLDPATLPPQVVDVEAVIEYQNLRGSQRLYRTGKFTRDVVLLKLSFASDGYGDYTCEWSEELEVSSNVIKVLGDNVVQTLYLLGQSRLSRNPRPQEEKPACSFVTMWEFQPGAGATFLGVLDLNLEASRREAVLLAEGLSQLADSANSLSEDARRYVASAEAYLRRLAVDPRWPAAEIRAQLMLVRESLGDGATAEQADLLRDLARRFGLSADVPGPREM